LANAHHIKRILVVDDEESILTLIEYIFEDQRPDYHLTTAIDYFVALTSLQQQRFDLILIDWHLNGMDGFDLAENIQGISPDTPILLMSGSDISGLDGKVKSLFSGSIQKPFTVSQLVDKIEQAMDR